jgi:hypothetical protein
MSIDLVPKPLYPLVPQVAGVPALLRGGAAILDTLTFNQIGFGDALGDIIGTDPSKWGIFSEQGDSIADYDSIYSFDYTNASAISNFPVEEGGFTSYNKVANPYDIEVVINCGGGAARRSACLTALQLARDSTDLYSIFTEIDTILNANLVNLSYRQTANEGAGLLTARLQFIEVRNTASANYANPKTPNAFDPESGGQLQPVEDQNIDVAGWV